MTRHLRNAFLASIGIGALAVGAATVAIAGFTSVPAPELPAPVVAENHDDGADFATPVTDAALFVSETAGACVTADEVVTRLQADRAAIGGETVMLADGLEQAFADAWRRQVELTPVSVSTVVAHVFKRDAASAAAVDVVEIDNAGCAMTRTILSGDEWAHLLQAAAGVGA